MRNHKEKPMKPLLLIFVFCLIAYSSVAQDNPKKFEFSGYVSDMPSVILQNPDTATLWENLLHNRFNLGWQANDHWRLDAGMRNRLIVGNIVEQPGYAESIDFDKGWADLSWNLVNSKNALLNTSLDRLFVTFEKDKWNLKLGRQRINWGQNFVWNPDDIFNTYSYFDFDYVERPGCDAFRGTYYHNETAYTELAASVDHFEKVTAALLHHWNWKNFDYQLIAGIYTQSDYVLGGAWSGDFKGLNFRGEFSYFQPVKHFSDTTGTLAFSLGFDYLFKNSLMLQTEVLYNNVGGKFSANGLLSLYTAPLSAKYLSVCNWSIFGQATYPVTPRLSAALSGMYFVEIKSCYAGLSLDFSVLENLDFSLITQYFTTIGQSNLGTMQSWLGFLRLKYSF